MLEVNSIKTVFAHQGEIGGSEELLTYDKNITPEQEALLRGLNFREYPTIQELEAKLSNNSETGNLSVEKSAEDKEKGQHWLSSAKSNSQAITDNDLNSVAKVIEDFENPNIDDRKNANDDILFRDSDKFTVTDKAIARDAYERMVKRGTNQFTEAMQDGMLSLKNLYKAVLKAQGKKFDIEEVAGYENAYLAENRMHSASEAQIHAWHRVYFKPIVKEIYRLTKNKSKAREELADYMMAKHGLERNRVLAQRDFDAYQRQRSSCQQIMPETGLCVTRRCVLLAEI